MFKISSPLSFPEQKYLLFSLCIAAIPTARVAGRHNAPRFVHEALENEDYLAKPISSDVALFFTFSRKLSPFSDHPMAKKRELTLREFSTR